MSRTHNQGSNLGEDVIDGVGTVTGESDIVSDPNNAAGSPGTPPTAEVVDTGNSSG